MEQPKEREDRGNRARLKSNTTLHNLPHNEARRLTCQQQPPQDSAHVYAQSSLLPTQDTGVLFSPFLRRRTRNATTSAGKDFSELASSSTKSTRSSGGGMSKTSGITVNSWRVDGCLLLDLCDNRGRLRVRTHLAATSSGSGRTLITPCH